MVVAPPLRGVRRQSTPLNRKPFVLALIPYGGGRAPKAGHRRMGRLEYSSPWRYVTDVRLDPLLPIEQLITRSFSTRGSSSGLS
jgi:hypothetical protein